MLTTLLSLPQADVEVDGREEMTVEIDNVHKTYLLGVEGVPALRCVVGGGRKSVAASFRLQFICDASFRMQRLSKSLGNVVG